MKQYVLAAVFFLLLSGVAFSTHAAGTAYDVGTTTNWNIRIDGPTDSGGSSSALTYASLDMGDLNGNDIPDLVVGARRFDASGRTDAGAIYVIYDDTLSALSGTGNTINLDTTSNWNIRFDALAGR